MVIRCRHKLPVLAMCIPLCRQPLRKLVDRCHHRPTGWAGTATERVVLPAAKSDGYAMPRSMQLVRQLRHSSPLPWIGAIAISLLLWSLIIWGIFVAVS